MLYFSREEGSLTFNKKMNRNIMKKYKLMVFTVLRVIVKLFFKIIFTFTHPQNTTYLLHHPTAPQNTNLFGLQNSKLNSHTTHNTLKKYY